MAADNQKRRNIMIYTRKTGCKAPSANSNKLVQQNHAAQPGAGPNPAMAAYLNIITQNNPVLNHAVVPDMNAYHKQIIAAHLRRFARMHTRMNCHLLANRVVVANDKPADRSVRIQTDYLRPAAKRAVGEKVIVTTQLDIPAYHNIRVENSARPDRNTFVNNTIRADCNSFAQLNVTVNHCARMYLYHLLS